MKKFKNQDLEIIEKGKNKVLIKVNDPISFNDILKDEVPKVVAKYKEMLSNCR